MLTKVATIADHPAVTLDELKAHALIPLDETEQDDPLRMFLASAIEWVERHTSRTLAAASFQYRVDAWPGEPIELPAAPVRDVEQFAYVGEDGIEYPLDADEWDWELTEEGADVWLTSDFSRPELHQKRRGCVRVYFDAGYDDPQQSGSGSEPRLALPFTLRLAVLQVAKTWFENRDAIAGSEQRKGELAAQVLADQLRIYR